MIIFIHGFKIERLNKKTSVTPSAYMEHVSIIYEKKTKKNMLYSFNRTEKWIFLIIIYLHVQNQSLGDLIHAQNWHKNESPIIQTIRKRKKKQLKEKQVAQLLTLSNKIQTPGRDSRADRWCREEHRGCIWALKHLQEENRNSISDAGTR